MGTGRARRRCRGVDRISGLPDELLHEILRHLPSTADAARTSVLSRRWRGVWAHVPAFSLSEGDLQARGASFLQAIDAALDAHAAPMLDRLAIFFTDDLYSLRLREADLAARLASWLRCASCRLTGELSLRLTMPSRYVNLRITFVPQILLAVPVCERATAINLKIKHTGLDLRFHAAGTFAAPRALTITGKFHLHVPDLERAVCSQCPRLQELTLGNGLGCSRDLTIRSDSLERLKLGRVDVKITVRTPRLVRWRCQACWGQTGRSQRTLSPRASRR